MIPLLFKPLKATVSSLIHASIMHIKSREKNGIFVYYADDVIVFCVCILRKSIISRIWIFVCVYFLTLYPRYSSSLIAIPLYLKMPFDNTTLNFWKIDINFMQRTGVCKSFKKMISTSMQSCKYIFCKQNRIIEAI